MVLKIVKHCQQALPSFVTGQLLGLDIGRTLEVLETNGVAVAALGSDEFPAFFTRSSGWPVGKLCAAYISHSSALLDKYCILIC